MNIHQWKHHVHEFNKEFGENKEIQAEWTRNTKENFPRFNKENTIWTMEGMFEEQAEKAMVLVGASPCLTEDVEKLKQLDDNFIIICANSSLKFLLKNGIKPHYCISLDSDLIDIPQHLDCPESKDITLLASSATAGKSLDVWKGPIFYMAYYSIDPKIRPKLRRKLGKKVVSGGNSMSQALVVVTTIWGAKTVIFVANEYCFNKKDYYADKTAAKQEKIEVTHSVKDSKGRTRVTIPALFTYYRWMDKTCGDLTPPGFFIDTSFGLLGRDNPAIHNMELDEAITKVKWAFNKAKELTDGSEKERLKIIGELSPKGKSDGILRWNIQDHREDVMRMVRMK